MCGETRALAIVKYLPLRRGLKYFKLQSFISYNNYYNLLMLSFDSKLCINSVTEHGNQNQPGGGLCSLSASFAPVIRDYCGNSVCVCLVRKMCYKNFLKCQRKLLLNKKHLILYGPQADNNQEISLGCVFDTVSVFSFISPMTLKGNHASSNLAQSLKLITSVVFLFCMISQKN